MLKTLGGAGTLGLAGCLGSLGGSGSGDELNMLVWTYTMDDEYVKQFEDEHDVTVNVDSAQSSAENLSLLRAERSNHDIVAAGTYIIPPLVEEGLVQPLDTSRLETWDGVWDFVRDFEDLQYDDNYLMPTTLGLTPVAYNPELLPHEPEPTLTELWNEDYDGLIGGRDDARLQILYARVAHDLQPINPSSVDEVDWDELRQLLVDRLELTNGLWSSGGDSSSLLTNEQVGIQELWHYVPQTLKDEGFPVEVLDSRKKTWVTGYTIPETAENIDLAYEWTDFYIKEAGPAYAESSGTYIANEEAMSQVDGMSKDELGDPSSFIVEQSKPEEVIQRYSEIWNEAKTEAGT
jgi:spermidine/putrescine transport system substrate-binding protein